jgi:hypothetical protein
VHENSRVEEIQNVLAGRERVDSKRLGGRKKGSK